jgi:hypothetical protein
VTVVGRLDDPLTLQLLDSQGLTIGIENPDLQTAAALTECWRPGRRRAPSSARWFDWPRIPYAPAATRIGLARAAALPKLTIFVETPHRSEI